MNGITLILDANLLLLLVVGMTDRDLIKKHKRLTTFTTEDYDLLCTVLAAAAKILVTPNTLTETSNLMRYIDEPARSQISAVFQQLVIITDEEYIPSRTAVAVREFSRLGLTDAALLEGNGQERRSLLTTDLELYLAAQYNGLSAVNFNHLRDQNDAGAE